MTSKTVAKIPGKKIKIVKELDDLLKTKKTILIVSIKNIPAAKFQEISKKLREKAIIKVPKKNLISQVLENSKSKKTKELKEKIEDSIAFLFSDLDAYELTSELLKNRTPAKAKAGQIAPMDIEIPAGPTGLTPGPAISELGALGIQIQIKEGKIEIKESKVIAKEGEKISQGAADLMSKLDIKPFSLGFIPLVALDMEKEILYSNIEVDSEKAINSLKESFAKSLAFSVEIGYFSEETIKLMINKAGAYEKKIIRVITGEPEPEIVEEKQKKQKEKETPSEIKKEEPKADAGAGLASLFG